VVSLAMSLFRSFGLSLCLWLFRYFCMVFFLYFVRSSVISGLRHLFHYCGMSLFLYVVISFSPHVFISLVIYAVLSLGIYGVRGLFMSVFGCFLYLVGSLCIPLFI